MTNAAQPRDALPGWRARLDLLILGFGTLVAPAGVVAQATGFLLAFGFDDPIRGYSWLTRSFWLAGLGGAGMVYGVQTDAGGSIKYPGGPLTYTPPRRRWPAALGAVGLTGLWGALSLPFAILFWGLLVLVGCGYGVTGAVQLARRLRVVR